MMQVALQTVFLTSIVKIPNKQTQLEGKVKEKKPWCVSNVMFHHKPPEHVQCSLSYIRQVY